MVQETIIGKPTILIYTQQNQAIGASLASLSCNTTLVNDPTWFATNLGSNTVSLLILDDIQLCADIRGQVAVPIIVISYDVEAALDAGADDCLPYHPQLLQRRVKSLLDEHPYPMYDNIPAMICITDADDTIIYANPAWLIRLGYKSDQVIGKPLVSVMSAISRRVAPKVMQSFRTTGNAHTVAYRYLMQNGTEIDVLADTTLLEKGCLLTVLRDITELKAAERSLRASRTELASILRALPDAVLVMDRDGIYVHIVSEDNSYPDLDLYNFLGKSVHDTHPKDVANRLLNAIQAAITTGIIQQTEYELFSDNKMHIFQVTASAINQEECVLVMHNITEQRTIEESLTESEQNYRQLFENATDAIFVVDVMTGNILQASPQASFMLGYSQEELISMQLDAIESDQIAIHDGTEEDFSETNKLTVETQYKRHDGILIDVEVSSRAILQNQRLILISFVRDVTERKLAMQEVERQRNLAQALLDTANILNEENNLTDIIDIVLKAVHRIIPCQSANVMTANNKMAYMLHHIGYEELGFSHEEISQLALPLKPKSNLAWVIANKRTLRINNTSNSPKFEWIDNTTADHVKSLLTAPIVIDGTVAGFINLDSTQHNNFNVEHEKQLMAFANQLAIAMQRSEMIQTLQNQTAELEQRVKERTTELTGANEDLQAIQAQMANERNLLRTIIDTIPDAIYVKDTDHRFIIANHATIKHIPGVTTESELIGKTDYDLFPDEADISIGEEKHVMYSGSPIANQPAIDYDDMGNLQHLLINKIPMYDTTGKIAGLVGMMHNITTLKETQAQLEQVINSARCILWSATVTSRADSDQYEWDYRIINKEAAQNLFPLFQDALTYTDAWLNSIPLENQRQRRDMFATTLETSGKNYRLEYPLLLSDGTKYWLSEDVLIEQVDDTSWHVIGVCSDISARKVIEEQLKDLNEELEVRVISRTLELSKMNAQLITQIEETEKAEAAERRQRIIAEALQEGVAKLATTLDRDTIFDHLLNLMQNIIPHDASSIMLIEGNEAIIVHSHGYNGENIGLRFDTKTMDDIQQIQVSKKPIVIDNIDDFATWEDDGYSSWIESVLVIPITIDNDVIGIINLDSKRAHHFIIDDTDWLISFGEQVGLAIRNARYTTDLEWMVQKRTQELEFEQSQLRAILNGVTDGVVYTDLERKPQYTNRALEELSGFDEQEWLSGQAQQEMNTIPMDEHQDLWQSIIQRLKTHGVWSGETQLKRKDGSLFDAGLARTLVTDGNGDPVGIVTVIRDISDEKQLAEQKARFITKAAHELRTPVANLKTRLYLMKRRPDKFEDHLKVAEAVLNLMQNLVEHMFDLSRFERGIMEIAREPVNLQEFLNEVIQYQRPQAERTDVTLEVDMPPEPVTVMADPYRLTQVITNLIGNAIKHTQPSNKIVLQVQKQDQTILIDVIDKGSGIAEEHLPNLFQPFYQATQDQSGVGLGLAIVWEIVNAHGGTIDVKSAIGAGTTFHIRLPLDSSDVQSS